MSGPLEHAESSRGLCLSMGLLALALQAQTLQIPPEKKICPNKLPPLPPPQRPSTHIVRRPWKGISAPFRHAESSCYLHFAIELLVVAPQAKTFLATTNIRIFEDQSQIRFDKPVGTYGLSNRIFDFEHSNIRV
jgi:hypothetical protein